MNRDFSRLKRDIKRNHPLKDLTSWRIGGKAEYFYSPIDKEDFSNVLKTFQDIPVTILGAATNVLIRDRGVGGLVVYLRDGLQDIQDVDGGLYVEAGVRLTSLVNKCCGLGMIDASFMAGIPGALGGALKMNAGAYGDSIWQYVESVETINRLGEVKLRQAREFDFSYRSVAGLDKEEWFLSANLNFDRSDVEVAKEKVKGYLQKRSSSQPLNLPNCGSVFRNPDDDYAARLIEENNFKGRRIGGAEVSQKHANFIVNIDNASSSDVEELMEEIIAKVEKSSGIRLIPEVKILG